MIIEHIVRVTGRGKDDSYRELELKCTNATFPSSSDEIPVVVIQIAIGASDPNPEVIIVKRDVLIDAFKLLGVL